MKSHRSLQTNASPEWSFVIGNRSGRKVSALDGYRIGRNDQTSLETPLGLFKAFCDAYGCELRLDQKRLGKFLVYARVAGTGQIEAYAPPHHKIHLSVMAKPNAGLIELAFGYAIDLTKYKAMLET